ncbi:DUF221-domain-containing protein [Rhizoclosmatium globosum]|uniref:DUF221-domain-containing protein n=1 Tax=Rhizoclosmatium globosum TaxID=329046 RepID=A0A1Y2CT36_9FUNG|nr:DUF221-domain-containing protein [Rhizoclosmatium globosum]|eukprot:ORY50056.1 DUF221-domain-containing protein [Rhizoclosmatium globosum]
MVKAEGDFSILGVITSFLIQLLVAFACIIGFSILRPANKVVYQPKLKFASEDKRPTPLKSDPTAWITPIVREDSAKAVHQLGVDSVIFLKFVKYCFVLFCGISALGIPYMAVNANFERITGQQADIGFNNTELVAVKSAAAAVPVVNKTTTAFVPTATAIVVNGTVIGVASVSVTAVDVATVTATATAIGAVSNTVTGSAGAPTITALSTSSFGLLRARDSNSKDIDNSNLTVIFASSLNTLSINQLDVSSPWYWLPTMLTWVVSLSVYFMLYRLSVVYSVYRKGFFESAEFQQSLRHKTLLITNLNESLRSEASLAKFMSSRKDLDIPTQTVINRRVPHLTKLITEHEKLTKKLESVLNKYLADPNNIPAKRPTLNIGNDPFLGDSLNELEEKIYFLRAQPDSEHPVTSAAFVSYDNVVASHEAAQSFTLDSLGSKKKKNVALLNAKLSPQFDDILWENIGIPQAERYTRRMFALGLTVGISVGWVLLSGFITSLSNLSNFFAHNQAALDWLAANPKVKDFLQSYLAPILLAVLNFLLPIVLRITTVLQGAKSHAGAERSVLYKLFTFYMIQIFLFAAVSALITAYYQPQPAGVSITDEFKLQVTGAITGLANNSNFYITLLASYYAGYGIEIIQGVPLVLSFIKRRFFKLTPRENFELNKPPVFDFTRVYGTLLIAFTIALTFSIVAPIILPFAALFFGLVFVVMKYQLMYVYAVKNESHGSYFLKIFNLLLFSTGFFQFLTLTVIFAANIARNKSKNDDSTTFRQWMIVAPLPFLTIAIWVCARLWLLPKAMYCTSVLTVNTLRPRRGSSSEGSTHQLEVSDTSTIASDLEEKVLNPALVKPLMKVWVAQKSAHLLPKLYTPRYANIDEYENEHPEVAWEVELHQHTERRG